MMKSTKKCPLFSTISLAADGDEVAIEKILNHYDACNTFYCTCYKFFRNSKM